MLSKLIKNTTKLSLLISLLFVLNSCGGGFKLPGADARKVPVNAADRVAKNLEEGKGFRINDVINNKNKSGGNFEFATSNELWSKDSGFCDVNGCFLQREPGHDALSYMGTIVDLRTLICSSTAQVYN